MQFHIRKTPITPLIISIPHAGSYYPKEFLKYKSIDIKKLKIMEDFKTDTFIDKINLNLADIFIAECSRAVVDLNRSRQSLDNSMFNSKIKTTPHEEVLLIKSGPGTRDGLMKGISENFHKPIYLIRLSIEIVVVILGWILGGTVGLGTLMFAILIGPIISVSLIVIKRTDKK